MNTVLVGEEKAAELLVVKRRIEEVKLELDEATKRNEMDKAKLRANIKDEIKTLNVLADTLDEIAILQKCLLLIEKDERNIQRLKDLREIQRLKNELHSQELPE